MKTKRLLCIFLSFMMLFSACGRKETERADENSGVTTEETAGTGKEEPPETRTDPEEASDTRTETEAGAETGNAPELQITVERDTKYNAANLQLSPEEFEAVGFALGDSCDLAFSNGVTISDVPYYNGYYVRNGEPVIVSYPGFTYVSITYNNAGIWDAAGLSEGDTVTITLHEAGKYAAVQESLGQVYSFLREDYETDEEFCNFREIRGGRLKEGLLYRGASPVDNERGRAAFTDSLLRENGIAFVLDLADSEEDLASYRAQADFASDYTLGLFENGQVALLSMGSAYQSQEYREKLVSGLRQMLLSPGPVYIHCMEGKDRTGFVCMLLLALAGGTYEELRADYMLTYRNYYKISEEATPEKYEAVSELYFDAFLEYLHGEEGLDWSSFPDFVSDAENYLLSGGMTEEEIGELKSFLTGE